MVGLSLGGMLPWAGLGMVPWLCPACCRFLGPACSRGCNVCLPTLEHDKDAQPLAPQYTDQSHLGHWAVWRFAGHHQEPTSSLTLCHVYVHLHHSFQQEHIKFCKSICKSAQRATSPSSSGKPPVVWELSLWGAATYDWGKCIFHKAIIIMGRVNFPMNPSNGNYRGASSECCKCKPIWATQRT